MKPPNNFEQSVTAALTAAALTTGPLSPAIDALREPTTIRPEVHTVRASSRDIGGMALGPLKLPRNDDPTLVSSALSEDKTQVVNERRVSVKRPWAFEFSASPEASQQPTSDEMITFTIALQEAGKNGEIVKSIRVNPYASDEADTYNDQGVLTPGLNEPNPENVALADTRGRAVGPVAAAVAHAVLGKEVSVDYKPGVEVIDAVFAKKEAELAQKFNMTPIELIAKYNHGETVPDEARQVLDKLIDDRRVDLTIVSEKPLLPSVTFKEPLNPPPTARMPIGQQTDVVPPYLNPKERTVNDKSVVMPIRDRLGNYQPAINRLHKQPRNTNFSKNPANPRSGQRRGRLSRTTGGDKA